MKKTILFILLCGFLTTVNAQKDPSVKRAKQLTEVITAEMGLNKAKEAALNEAILERFQSNAANIKGKDLTKEEKQVVYRTAHKNFTKKLSGDFSKEELAEITKIMKEQNAKAKKSK